MAVGSPAPGLYITGLGSQYPPYLLAPHDLENFAARYYDLTKPGIKKLLQLNRSTSIETRSAIRQYDTGFATDSKAPSIADIDNFFREAGVDLAVQACKKALGEANMAPEQITHTIGVTCTNQGNPGYDLVVARELDLPLSVDRTLLHGVGCAGGLSLLRAAAQLAGGASVRRKPARILAFACELCTPNVRYYLSLAEQYGNSEKANIAGALFSDAAAAFVLCNEYAVAQDQQSIPQLELLEWGCDVIPDTVDRMSFYADYTTLAIGPMFNKLLLSYEERLQPQGQPSKEVPRSLEIGDFDWALHPGGKAIIDGASEGLQLSEEQLQTTREIYRTRGNSSSASVLIVLDQIRSQSNRQHIVATSFGPGLTIEMALLRKCQVNHS
ncbi:hypothetical protein N7541_004370 [Penicillium brevicompactum]|uniref:Uncharacterized protein n=1 Tax=Penicillium brevicompactum TaxID=5074 RepID=A0A9W9RBM7_PENBR|nr:hypothetical protein N7541_004370 [Penicillium brevicompactum]